MTVSLLSIFNWLSPKDQASHSIARDVRYGPAERHQLDIYAPRNQSGPLPVVVFLYGGAWNDGSRSQYAFVGRALAAQGFVTVVADYRLVPEVEYPHFLTDCGAAVEWVAGHIDGYGGDPQRIALMGHSAGAYNAAMLALDPSQLARRGLMERIRCVVGLAGPYDFFPFDGPISLRTFGAVRDPMATQPIHYASAEARPMFLASGDKDQLVRPRNTAALARRLSVVGVAVEERHYANLDHPGILLALGRPARRLAPVLKEASAFLHRHLDAAQAAVA